MVTGWGKIDGRLVFVFSQDFTVLGGSISEVVGQKVCKIMDMAMNNGAPVIGINDSGGARIQEGVASLGGVGEISLRNTLAPASSRRFRSSWGPRPAAPSTRPALTDFVFMVKGIGQMYITGPDVVKAVTDEEVSHEELGGAEVHARRAASAHFIADNEEECFAEVRRLLGFLPQNNHGRPARLEPDDDPDRTDDEPAQHRPGRPRARPTI